MSDEHDVTPDASWRSGWFITALVGSIAYLVFLWLVVPACDTATENSSLLERYASCLQANTLGDFLAGAFAPLAFLWLVTAVAIQSQELSAQRKELKLTRAELKATREVAKEQVAEARNQAKHIEAQTEILTRQEADKAIRTLIDGICSFAWENLQRPINIKDAEGNNTSIRGVAFKVNRGDFDLKTFSAKAVQRAEEIKVARLAFPGRRVFAGDFTSFPKVRFALDEIHALKPACSVERQVYLNLVNFDDLRASIVYLLEVCESEPKQAA